MKYPPSVNEDRLRFYEFCAEKMKEKPFSLNHGVGFKVVQTVIIAAIEERRVRNELSRGAGDEWFERIFEKRGGRHNKDVSCEIEE